MPHWYSRMEASSLSGRSWRSAQARLLHWFSRRADCGVCDGAPPPVAKGMIMRPNYALKLTSAATAAPLTASVLRTAWRAARLVHWRVAAPGGGARSLTRIR